MAYDDDEDGLDYGTASSRGKVILSLEPELEKQKLGIAKGLLLGIAILFTLSAIAEIFAGEQGKAVFETTKTIFPPIVTLVIGYYFSEKSSRGRTSA